MNNQLFTEKQWKWIADRYLEGYTQKMLAEFLGLARNTVERHFQKMGVIPYHRSEVELPPFTAGFIKSKSGLNVKHNLTSEGVLDVGYTGSIVVKLYNHGETDYQVKMGDKISQLVVVDIHIPHLQIVDELEDTARGNNGFGSTGR